MEYQHKKIGNYGHRILVKIAGHELTRIRQNILNELQSAKDFDLEDQNLIQRKTVEAALNTYFSEILLNLNLAPVAPVQFTTGKFTQDSDFEFMGEFEIIPELTSVETNGVIFAPKSPEISETLLNQEVDRLLLPFATAIDQKSDHRAKVGSLVFFELDYIFDGKELPEKGMKRQALLIGSQQFKLKIDNDFVGMSINESKIIDHQLPELFNIPELAGQRVKLKLLITKIQELQIPILDQNFIEKHFSKVPDAPQNIAEFKSFVRAQLQNRLQFESYSKEKVSTLKHLAALNPLPLPQSMVDQLKKSLIAQEAKEAQKLGKYEAPSHNTPRDHELTRFAQDLIRVRLIVEFLAKKNGIIVNPEDVESHIQTTSKIFGTSPEDLKKQLESADLKAQLHYTVLENKVLNLFVKTI
jgi:trigger factor